MQTKKHCVNQLFQSLAIITLLTGCREDTQGLSRADESVLEELEEMDRETADIFARYKNNNIDDFLREVDAANREAFNRE